MNIYGKDGSLIGSIDPCHCKFFIFDPAHYFDDGTCKCDDMDHRAYMIANWGYSEDDFT